MEINLEDIINVALDILEESNSIKYTSKFTREYIIEGFSQVDTLPHWKWFGYCSNSGLIRALDSRIQVKRPKRISWFKYLIQITGYKQCSKCKEMKEFSEFSKRQASNDGLRSDCRYCDAKRSKEYKENNKEEIRKNNKIAVSIYKKKNPGKIKAQDAKRRAAKLLRTPIWITSAELLLIEEFYNNCPIGYHVDHIYPLQGKEISGLHVLSNLQYL